MNMERAQRTHIGEIAERLCQQATAADYEAAPTPLEEMCRISLPAEDPVIHVEAALQAIEERLGPPAQYGGSGIGPSIRWQSATNTLLLDQGSGGLQLSIHRSNELADREAAVFHHGVGTGIHQVATYRELPYLWQLYRHDAGTPATTAPPPPPASDWLQLEQSVRTLLIALSDQLPTQLGKAGAGFNVLNHADGDRVLAVLCNPDDELMALIDTTDSPDQWSPGHAEYEKGMTSRGWHSKIPLARWWEASFPRSIKGATALASLIVCELRSRGARGPADLGLSNLSIEETLDTGGPGRDLGQLFLPGLGVRH
ncbi:hypothetical protein [Streptomyces sp. NPDC102409]|uniref:hypothetical protein n=1 Tax=Streptomyces sp. NPDC102409 TaxID=3366172 RepID=UPI0037FD8B70